MNIIIYLLHFDTPVEKCQHYIGSCEQKRFDRRMQEHARGYGANLTTKAFQAGKSFVIARIWSSPTRDYEKRLKQNGHYKQKCPLCNSRLNLELPLRPNKATTEGLAKSDFKAVGFPP